MTEPSDFRDRVREEEKTLASNIGHLIAFVITPTYHDLPADEQERMKHQLYHMNGYLSVLRDRINAFPRS